MLNDLKQIRIDDYDYPLPDERIAKFPLPQRDQSKLLCLKKDTLSEHHFCDLPSLLPREAMLVFNDTKVIHARLLFRKDTGAVIEVFCLEPRDMDVAETFAQDRRCSWTCFIGNNKKWKSGPLTLNVALGAAGASTLTATRREAEGNAWVVDFEWTGGARTNPLQPRNPISAYHPTFQFRQTAYCLNLPHHETKHWQFLGRQPPHHAHAQFQSPQMPRPVLHDSIRPPVMQTGVQFHPMEFL